MKKPLSEFPGFIPFNSPFLTGKELVYIQDAHQNGQLAGDGKYTELSSSLISKLLGSGDTYLTHSCTAALEMIAILLDLRHGDEVIMPSFTFVSTANAFVLRGVVPVFVDVDPITYNIDPSKIEDAISSKTKVIMAVHYAGVSCDMDKLICIAKKYNLKVIEDSAQALMSKYKGKSLGTIGELSAFSFHETKNVISGEGGALVVNDSNFLERAEIIREKGTNRSKFFRGEVDKYTWVDIGSSFLPGEIIAAFLYSQLIEARSITDKRISNWNKYHEYLQSLELEGKIKRQVIPDFSEHNAHMFFIILNSLDERTQLVSYLKSQGIQAVFHYVPLHSSPAGIKYAKSIGSFDNTHTASTCLLRLPLGCNVDVERIVDAINKFFMS